MEDKKPIYIRQLIVDRYESWLGYVVAHYNDPKMFNSTMDVCSDSIRDLYAIREVCDQYIKDFTNLKTLTMKNYEKNTKDGDNVM